MKLATTISWALLALVHALPALAALRPTLLTTLYGIEPGAPAYLLLQHRAALFAVVVLVAGWAIVDPAVRRLASVAVAISMVSFLVMWFGAGRPAALRTIAIADLAALAPLAFVAWRAWRS